MSDNAQLPQHSKVGGSLAMIVGGLLVAAAIFADEIGLSGGGVGLGWKQLIAAILGVIIILIGIAWIARPGAWSISED